MATKQKLTPKQARFVEEYLVDLNATQAAIRAGYSEKTAAEQGYDNLRKPQLAEAIQAAQESRSKRTEITADRVLEELAKVGFANAGDYFDWGPEGIGVKDKAELSAEQQAAVAEVSETTTQTGGTVRLKLHDKIGALEKIGRHLGMFKDIVEVRRGIEDMTDDELIAIARGSGSGTAESAGGPSGADRVH